jgi:PTS system mannose-specific IIA component
VKLAKIRGTEPLIEAVDSAARAGRKYIAAAGDLINGATASQMPGVPKTPGDA